METKIMDLAKCHSQVLSPWPPLNVFYSGPGFCFRKLSLTSLSPSQISNEKSWSDSWNRIFFFLVWFCSIWDLSSLTRDQTHTCALEAWSLDHWSPGKFWDRLYYLAVSLSTLILKVFSLFISKIQLMCLYNLCFLLITEKLK